jgi:hypothetical protein
VPESRKPLEDAFPKWAVTPTLANMREALIEAPSLSELFKLANDPDFQSAVATLNDADKASLRGLYSERRDALDVKVKLETFDGQVINVVGIDWWHSDRFVDESKGQTGDGVTLHVRTAPDKLVKVLTSSSPVVRFCNRLRDLPSEAKPVRVFVELVPVRDPARAARGQMMWSIKQMPPERKPTTDGNVPF